MTTRDISDKEFKAACERRGFEPRIFGLGYYQLPCGVSVSVFNAPRDTNRARLAYLIRKEKHWAAKKREQKERMAGA